MTENLMEPSTTAEMILPTFDGHSDKPIRHLSEVSLKDAAKRLGVSETLSLFPLGFGHGS